MTVYLTLEEINALLDAPSLTDEDGNFDEPRKY